MYNKEILDELIREFGEENTILFCKMESKKNAMLCASIEIDKQHHPEPNEWKFERDWWANSAEQLITRKK